MRTQIDAENEMWWLSAFVWLGALTACSPSKDTASEALLLEAAPAADDWEVRGTGGPSKTFTTDQLFTPCAWLNGGPESAEHHNLAVMHDGWLLFPWAPEDGGGGITFFDVSDPCAPTKVGEVWHPEMRESHTLATGVVEGREYLAVGWHVDNQTGGVGFFDITDPSEPVWVSAIELPGYGYPDAYFRVALSTTWVGDHLYVAAGLLGVFTLDVSEPESPVIVNQVSEAGHVVGTFHVIGDVGIASSAGLARVMTYDVSDPREWTVRADFQVQTSEDPLENFYFANMGGEYALFARKDNGGGPIVYDVTDPDAPSFVGTFQSDDGDGGYVFRHGDLLFQGESNFGAVYDFPAPDSITERGRFALEGDLDTVTPIGNVAVVSVDEGGESGQATGIFPWTENPDTDAPSLRWHRPDDGAVWVALTTAIGLSFDELLEPRSAHAGSVRMWAEDGGLVSGRLYVMESMINLVPDEPLQADTTYFVEVATGGVADSSGNSVQTARRFSFSTGDEVRSWDEVRLPN